jgi:hypothetical protein
VPLWRRRSWTRQSSAAPFVDDPTLPFDNGAFSLTDVPIVDQPKNLTAAALALSSLAGGRRALVPQYESWQRELWDYYDTLGDFGYAVTWRANMVSRVRLRAGKVEPGNDEPTIVDEGPAAEVVAELTSEISSTSDVMSTLSTHLDIPGEGWLIGENIENRNVWQVRSNDEIRRRVNTYEVISEESALGNMIWRELAPEHYIVRIWRPHRRYRHLAYSPAKAARSAMRELELSNRHIQAQYLSRLASAGIIVFPDEITFPVRPEFQDAPDPFVREWIETASEAINTPGTAASIVPIPMRVPGEYIDKIKHIDFTLKLDEKIIEKRDAARRALAAMINVPTELLFDAGSLNHWGLWQLEESAIKVHIAPDVEIITNGLTVGYLHPRLRALGQDDWRDWVVWYDASEIIARPDRSANVLKAYDRFEVNGKTLRREIGLTEDDAPTKRELQDMVLKRLSSNPQIGFIALHELTGMEIPEEAMPEQPDTDVVGQRNANHRSGRDLPADREDEHYEGEQGTSGGDSNRAPGDDLGMAIETGVALEPGVVDRLARRDAFAVLQANSQHVMEFTVTGWKLKHPLLCREHLFSCPFTYATRDGLLVRPGTSGDYECMLDRKGDVVIGRRVFTNANQLLPTDPKRTTNGHRH